jgi:hypothetical protein
MATYYLPACQAFALDRFFVVSLFCLPVKRKTLVIALPGFKKDNNTFTYSSFHKAESGKTYSTFIIPFIIRQWPGKVHT